MNVFESVTRLQLMFLSLILIRGISDISNSKFFVKDVSMSYISES